MRWRGAVSAVDGFNRDISAISRVYLYARLCRVRSRFSVYSPLTQFPRQIASLQGHRWEIRNEIFFVIEL